LLRPKGARSDIVLRFNRTILPILFFYETLGLPVLSVPDAIERANLQSTRMMYLPSGFGLSEYADKKLHQEIVFLGMAFTFLIPYSGFVNCSHNQRHNPAEKVANFLLTLPKC